MTGGDFGSEMDTIIQFYGSDFSRESLRTQYEIMYTNYDGEGQANIHEVFKYCRNLTPANRALMGEIIKLVKLLMTIPATTDSSERAFSTLRCIKNYFHTTMFQEHLNNLMVTYNVYKDRLDLLDVTSISQDFVNDREGRISLLGSFSLQ